MITLNPLYTHDQHQMVVMHARSGMLAIADRTAIECAREDEVRSGFTTSFLSIADATSNLRDPDAFPRGEQVARPSPEAARWREAVLATLDAYAAMPFGDRYFVNLQHLWIDPTHPEARP